MLDTHTYKRLVFHLYDMCIVYRSKIYHYTHNDWNLAIGLYVMNIGEVEFVLLYHNEFQLSVGNKCKIGQTNIFTVKCSEANTLFSINTHYNI
jgi:hypothetical protein